MPERRRAPWLAAAGLGVHALLAAGALATLPGPARLALAFVALVLVPGAALLRLTAGPPGGPWLAAGWALGFGVAWNAALVLLTRGLGVPFTVLDVWALAPNALLWAAALARRRDAATEEPLGGPAALAIGLAAALALWHVGTLGPPLTIYSDSPDHVGTIRRMMASGDAFPRDAFFRDAGAAGADPRKALWHPQVALVAGLAGVDPVEAWRGLAALLAALFVLNAAALGHLLRGPAGAAVAAWALLLFYGRSLAQPLLREAVFSTKLADQLALAATVAVLADLVRRRRRTRLAAVLLGLGAVATHVYAAIQLALVLTALGAGLLLRDRRLGPDARRLAGTALALGAASLPWLLWRASHAYAPVNPIHTAPQGMLILWDGVKVAPVGMLWDWLGRFWVLFPLCWAALWRAGRDHPAALYLLTTPAAVALVLFVPPVPGLLEPHVGYLLFRMVWMIPLYGLLAWLLPRLVTAVRSGPRRAPAALALVGVGVLAWPPLSDAVLVLRRPAVLAAPDERDSALRWREELAWADRHLPPGTVVLSDPATSYAIPMLTRHYVVTLVDQHSSPNDPHALSRLLDARDALDPWSPWERTREVVGRHGVGAIVLNGRFAETPRLDYWAPRPEWFAAARARLDAHPEAFPRLRDLGDFVVYRVDRAALGRLDGAPPPRPFVQPHVSGRFPVARRTGEGVPAIVSFRLERRTASPGDTLQAVARWRAREPQEPGSYQVAVRFDAPMPGGFDPPDAVRKPARKLVERVRGERYRFRLDHLPVGGAYGVDLWRPDQVVDDSFEVVVPRDVAEGDYTVQVRMLHKAHYPNYRLSDWFSDADYFSGVPVGVLRISRDPAAGPPAAAGAGGR